ncbi:hypothetical protein A2Z00_00325 [Candidatus Gottesmanbacteria bacterium RBG_13_45_10]|uniref:Uncharacterized protein n=1 Tax=Candidatus Gottesmanbacteria bacterium RBG_13_45_10 TaxID=1798370 RepID=A0A1F5ZID8_9BACT|nr:MAG: hypothetical protein A2Z00_00325 [Candidatus Gottesmanbacteria bacterium RBG_13_45_10]
MKIAIFLLFLGLVTVVLLFPFVMKEKACYEQSQVGLDFIGYSVPARGWDITEVCKRRVVVLGTLEECIHQATRSGGLLTKYTNGVVQGAVYIVRPLTKGFDTLKTEHNQECADYEQYQM